MTKAKRQRKRARKGKRTHDSKACSFCGESEKVLKNVTVKVSGKTTASWRCCRVCLAMKMVAIGALPRH